MPLLMRLFIKLVINSLALFAADYLVSGIVIKDFWSGVIAAGLLGIMNASLKPVIVILTLPINLISLGLFTFVINAFMLKLVAWAVGGLVITGFWAAFWGAVIISFVSWLLSLFLDTDYNHYGHRGR
jgi:putative membrane protein